MTSPIRIRRLIALIVLAAVGYGGYQFGGVYWRKYQLQEMVQQDFGFAGQLTVESIRQKVLDDVASVDLPASRRVQWEQADQPRSIGVTISYVETIDLLFAQKQWPVTVQIKRSY